MESTRKRIYYVSGYGRSGSTLLGRLEGHRNNAVVVGEAHVLSSAAYLEDATCSCGAPFPTCTVWRVFEMELRELEDDESKVSHTLRKFLEGIWGLFIPKFLLRRLVHKAAFSTRYPVSYSLGVKALANACDGSLVDTSKTTRQTANRPRLLASCDAEVVLCVATRPLADVVQSVRRARERQRKPMSPIISWIAIPLSRAMALFAARWVAVSLNQAYSTASLDHLKEEIGRTEFKDSQVDHLIAGNRMRHHHLTEKYREEW